MPATQDQIIACAALLLAATILRLSPAFVRKVFFIVVFVTGLLAAAATVAGSVAGVAVYRLFG